MVLRAYVQELRISWAELELLILLKTLSFSYAATIFSSWAWVTAVPVAHTKYARETLVLFLS